MATISYGITDLPGKYGHTFIDVDYDSEDRTDVELHGGPNPHFSDEVFPSAINSMWDDRGLLFRFYNEGEYEDLGGSPPLDIPPQTISENVPDDVAKRAVDDARRYVDRYFEGTEYELMETNSTTQAQLAAMHIAADLTRQGYHVNPIEFEIGANRAVLPGTKQTAEILPMLPSELQQSALKYAKTLAPPRGSRARQNMWKFRLHEKLMQANIILITYKAQPGPVGLPGSRCYWDRGHWCPRTVLVAPLSRACRGLEARHPRRKARDSAKPRGRAEDRA